MYVHSLYGKKANIGEKDRKGDVKATLAALIPEPLVSGYGYSLGKHLHSIEYGHASLS